MGLIISIGGRAGSGKSTVSRLLAKKLGFRHYSMGDLRRKMARERGMSLAEFNRLGEREDFTDREVDEFQKELGKKEGGFVIDGRTSFYFIPHSVKILLEADNRLRAERVFKDERQAEKFRSMEEAERGIEERDRSDIKRYKKYYGIDVADRKNYGLIIDTTRLTEEQTVDKIMGFLKKNKYI